jgi:orotidine-5'-phosphate decarboxylase
MGDAADRIIVAFDHPAPGDALALARRLAPRLRRVKVGVGLFAAGGADLVRSLRALGLGVFLDLKLHDIPNSVRLAARAVSALGVDLLTVHLAGGEAMARAAVEGAHEGGPTRILGITVLSSLDAASLRAIGMAGSPEEAVLRLARIGVAAGVDGAVSSPLEARALRPLLPPPRLIVTPGIRPRGGARASGGGRGGADDDQARTATAAEAIASGADLLVVGRPITGAADPLAALEALGREVPA